MEIKSFKINKLHNSLNFELKLENNTLILVGENGSCKTTIIKMLFYTLSLQWGKLGQYNFESIELLIDEDYFIITKDDITISSKLIDHRALRRLPYFIRHSFTSMIESKDNIDIQKLENVCQQYGFPIELIFKELSLEDPTLFSAFSNAGKKQKKGLLGSIHNLRKKMDDIHILYLPTYRRIEQDLKVVLDGRFEDEDFMSHRIKKLRYTDNNDNNYTELVEFGMGDVDDAIKTTSSSLKDSFRSSLNELTLGYLGDIVDGEYSMTRIGELSSIDDDTIHQIMDRVDETILSKERKDKLSKTIQKIKEQKDNIQDHDKVLCHYFLKLYESHKNLRLQETLIKDFVTVCSKYLQNKEMIYDSQNFDLVIKSKYNGDEIKLFQLSSGEKQIVSLFSHLYLLNKRNCLVLIDEPELSLSVKWQKMFLEDVKNGQFCKGLVAVTHSPFIFDNSLDYYAHGIEEFKK